MTMLTKYSLSSLWSLLLVAGVVAALPQQNHAGCGPSPPTVSTTSGRIHGKIDPSLPNVNQYLGIPYAVPPVGDRRWTAPELLSQPDVDVEATSLPPSCMQYLTDLGDSLYVRDVLQFNLQGLNTTGAITEDCLTLSVWAPSSSSNQPVPVLIFFYGGGFSTGGQDVPYQIPAQWVNRTPDHIVVSFNYRVNIFGFPNAGGLDQQNLGLLDQRAAVEWCRANIAAFGGDPERMVIWGQSAGSISVDYYNFAYHSDAVVKGLIMDSGTALSPIATEDQTHANFSFVAEHVGCANLTGDYGQQLACMRGVDAATLEDFVAAYDESGASPSISFVPVVDDKIVFANYTERAEAGLQAQIPAIIGTNAQDGVAFAPYNPAGPNRTVALEEKLAIFFCPATESIRLRQQTPDLTPTFRYVYFGNWTNISPRPWMGAYHSSELPMLMGTHPDFRGPSTPQEYATSEAFQDAYVAFAREGVAGLEAQAWNEYAALGQGQTSMHSVSAAAGSAGSA
ncbi:alpha/beta-hydrolase [Cryphonectria parasitica EP155]|uniref:Carboxylic ester hydrolase n=1 Tax=Cryphonectria parasitica (strain ATCC 38755 / EP155) TaxID=660469 RepID=A0A9P4XYM1_CRYP1|nr:alpha/beta-hydrolase [Cryphonectria parasitica EP155]KAF3763180.1 alpha/beta-hydrolase [Cryphonectria parasitica EP155]